MQDQFLLPPNISHITLEAFLRFEFNHISKTMILFFTPHTTKSKNLSNTPKSPNLVIHKPHQDQFLLLLNFSHITLEAFERIESSQFSKP